MPGWIEGSIIRAPPLKSALVGEAPFLDPEDRRSGSDELTKDWSNR
jgi:hypothetical protein